MVEIFHLVGRYVSRIGAVKLVGVSIARLCERAREPLRNYIPRQSGKVGPLRGCFTFKKWPVVFRGLSSRGGTDTAAAATTAATTASTVSLSRKRETRASVYVGRNRAVG